jgi:hypothetical protein
MLVLGAWSGLGAVPIGLSNASDSGLMLLAWGMRNANASSHRFLSEPPRAAKPPGSLAKPASRYRTQASPARTAHRKPGKRGMRLSTPNNRLSARLDGKRLDALIFELCKVNTFTSPSRHRIKRTKRPIVGSQFRIGQRN